MPTGPEGQKRPADVIGNAVRVMQIATGKVEEGAPLDDGMVWREQGGSARHTFVPVCQSTRFRSFAGATAHLRGVAPAPRFRQQLLGCDEEVQGVLKQQEHLDGKSMVRGARPQ